MGDYTKLKGFWFTFYELLTLMPDTLVFLFLLDMSFDPVCAVTFLRNFGPLGAPALPNDDKLSGTAGGF